MKKFITCFLSIIFISLSLNSCIFSNNKKTNYFIEGVFIGYNVQSDEKEEYYLEVNEIDEQDFNSAYGYNVIYDIVIKKYFHLSYYTYDENNNKSFINFKNLKDKYPQITAWPVLYHDDNEIELRPYFTGYHAGMKSYYSVMVYDLSSNNELPIIETHLERSI